MNGGARWSGASVRFMVRNIWLLVLFALAIPIAAHAQPAWDSRGWVNLGERTVNGRYDHDRIEVGRYDGRFSRLTFVVENADVEMLDVRIEFGDHTDWHPPITGFYREGTRTRVIEMPGGDRVIRFIDFRYRNVPGEWRAKVGVWGFRDGAAMAPPVAQAPVWDANGWTMLGEREVHGHGRENADRINVGRYEGRFSKLTVVVLDSDLELMDMTIQFGRGAPFRPAVAQFFREGTRTRVIDFPGDERTIQFIDFRYRNVPGEGHARIQVWGKAEMAPPPPPPPPPPPQFSWDQRGWIMLGEREVHGHGREDIDRIEVGRQDGRFQKLTVVVLDSDLELIDFMVKFEHGEPFHPAVNQFFREGTRTRVIELPSYGDGRTIRWVEFKYRNLPGEGHARVQVWAR
jgi:hypothetical protein